MGCLTIYTDASWHPNTKVAGYGIWIRDHKVQAKLSHSELKIRSNNNAEIRAIAFAFLYIDKKRADLFEGKTHCTVVTDSMVALEYYEGKQPCYKQEERDYVLNLIKKYNVVFNIRKVKAHSNKDGKRSQVNNLVDKLAGEARKDRERLMI